MASTGNQPSTSATSAVSGITTTTTANPDGTDMTPEEADAQLSSQTVKPYVILGTGGSNYYSWNKMLVTQARANRCYMAVKKDYPDTAVDAAATQLLLGSLPPNFQAAVSCLPTAHQGYKYIVDKYTGGANQAANKMWEKELDEGIRPEETLEDYVMRFRGIQKCLNGNGANTQDYQVMAKLVDGLPEEMEHATVPLHCNMAGRDWEQVLPILTHLAYAIKFDDKARAERATANLAQPRGAPAAPRSSKPSGGQQQRPRSLGARDRKPPFCKRCRSTGYRRSPS
jgi:hypothetical protein